MKSMISLLMIFACTATGNTSSTPQYDGSNNLSDLETSDLADRISRMEALVSSIEEWCTSSLNAGEGPVQQAPRTQPEIIENPLSPNLEASEIKESPLSKRIYFMETLVDKICRSVQEIIIDAPKLSHT
ncbi:MAG: hypothetical protein LBQ43_04545 [Holosporales bacterium]|nr:hypothetical protein [Holosporales bacterium]